MKQKDSKQTKKSRQHELLSDEETQNLKALIAEFGMKQDKIAYFVGTEHQSTVSIWLNENPMRARFRALLELLKLRKQINIIIIQN